MSRSSAWGGSDQLPVERDSAPRGMRVRACGLVPSLKGCSCSTIPDARRERRSARRASRAGGASPLAASARRKAQPVAQVEQGDLPRIVQTRDVVHGQRVRVRWRGSMSAFDARMYAAARLVPAKARRRCVLPLPPGPGKTKRSPPSRASRSAFSDAPFFPGKKIISVGRRRASSSRSVASIHAAERRRAFQLKSGRKHVTLSATPVLTSKKPITYRDAGVDIDAGDALVEAISLRKEDAAPGSARRNRPDSRARRVRRNTATRCSVGDRRGRHQAQARLRAEAARHGGHRSGAMSSTTFSFAVRTRSSSSTITSAKSSTCALQRKS